MNTYRIEMYKSKSIHRFCNVVAETDATAEMVAHYYNPGYWTVRSRLLYEGVTVDLCAREIGQDFPGWRRVGSPRGCRVCFLARKYGLTPREVNLIALISSGRSSRAMNKVLGIGITTIRERCRIIHRKIGAHSRLAIRLWAIRKGMVKSYRGGVSAMKSKLPQTISYSQTHRSREVVDVQQENIEDSSEPLGATRNRTTRSTWLLMPRPAS